LRGSFTSRTTDQTSFTLWTTALAFWTVATGIDGIPNLLTSTTTKLAAALTHLEISSTSSFCPSLLLFFTLHALAHNCSPNSYAAVTGTIDSFGTRKHINVSHIDHVEDVRETFFHQLCVIADDVLYHRPSIRDFHCPAAVIANRTARHPTPLIPRLDTFSTRRAVPAPTVKNVVNQNTAVTPFSNYEYLHNLAFNPLRSKLFV
jgi:hypothetical protein